MRRFHVVLTSPVALLAFLPGCGLGKEESGRSPVLTAVAPKPVIEGGVTTLSLDRGVGSTSDYTVLLKDDAGRLWQIKPEQTLDNQIDAGLPFFGLAAPATYQISARENSTGRTSNELPLDVAPAPPSGLSQAALAAQIWTALDSAAGESNASINTFAAEGLISSSNAAALSTEIAKYRAALADIRAQIEAMSSQDFQQFDKLLNAAGLTDFFASGGLGSLILLKASRNKVNDPQFDRHHHMLALDATSFVLKCVSKLLSVSTVASYAFDIFTGGASAPVTQAVREAIHMLSYAVRGLTALIDGGLPTDLKGIALQSNYTLEVGATLALAPVGTFERESTLLSETVSLFVKASVDELGGSLQGMLGDAYNDPVNAAMVQLTTKLEAWLPSMGFQLSASILGGFLDDGKGTAQMPVDLSAYDLSFANFLSLFTGMSSQQLAGLLDKVHSGWGQKSLAAPVRFATSLQAAEQGTYSTFASYDNLTNNVQGVSPSSGTMYVTWLRFANAETGFWRLLGIPWWYILHANADLSVIQPPPPPPAGPTITGFQPPNGPAGTVVIITGTNFTGATTVSFNQVPDPTFVVNSATQITATVPSGATSGPISVTTPASSATSAGIFTVVVPAQNDANSGGDAGNGFAAALLIAPGSYTGTLTASDTSDWYRFSAAAGQTITVTMTPPAGANYDVELRTPSNAFARASQNTAPGVSELISYVTTVTGEWRIRIWLISGTGNYTFSVVLSGGTASRKIVFFEVGVGIEEVDPNNTSSITFLRSIASAESDVHPVRSPDGTKIAFTQGVLAATTFG